MDSEFFTETLANIAEKTTAEKLKLLEESKVEIEIASFHCLLRSLNGTICNSLVGILQDPLADQKLKQQCLDVIFLLGLRGFFGVYIDFKNPFFDRFDEAGLSVALLDILKNSVADNSSTVYRLAGFCMLHLNKVRIFDEINAPSILKFIQTESLFMQNNKNYKSLLSLIIGIQCIMEEPFSYPFFESAEMKTIMNQLVSQYFIFLKEEKGFWRNIIISELQVIFSIMMPEEIVCQDKKNQHFDTCAEIIEEELEYMKINSSVIQSSEGIIAKEEKEHFKDDKTEWKIKNEAALQITTAIDEDDNFDVRSPFIDILRAERQKGWIIRSVFDGLWSLIFKQNELRTLLMEHEKMWSFMEFFTGNAFNGALLRPISYIIMWYILERMEAKDFCPVTDKPFHLLLEMICGRYKTNGMERNPHMIEGVSVTIGSLFGTYTTYTEKNEYDLNVRKVRKELKEMFEEAGVEAEFVACLHMKWHAISIQVEKTFLKLGRF
ncbi:uncharacterized protein MONOS_1188 [Monocercomonoides exilis]|uniref:uncharacterized protein n=1 Tax=Monocercomonoides exilis TaxID=2049356 RepID=UPI003559B73B|nr:hypothetical protein MONOS_1188 [Monocercomonoides exilis]|eukprot:MONOS_1188.1-p1 / transcript=MONOS_1188.1 / gene=MONOS_1188 / organism=Monocercomonoides_exilis_PA203 / gene_product=unspecified product / transcript_product=unspecified product / location=Mono_scaffold00020:100833-102371(-) / protein_length=493 / sequence_SO=supercontig / SO=protein_coding / is_pseudo=false